MEKKKPILNRFIDWVLANKIKLFIIIILLFAVPLIIVHVLFKWKSNFEWIQAEWSAGDLISYIAGFEAFIGTTFLSFLALWQNQRHKQENDAKDRKLIEIENEKTREYTESHVETMLQKNIDDNTGFGREEENRKQIKETVEMAHQFL